MFMLQMVMEVNVRWQGAPTLVELARIITLFSHDTVFAWLVPGDDFHGQSEDRLNIRRTNILAERCNTRVVFRQRN